MKLQEKVQVCVECVQYSANGGAEIDPQKVAEIQAGLNSYGTGAEFHYITDSEKGELSGGFSWSPCDVCGDTLGGDRFDGFVMWL